LKGYHTRLYERRPKRNNLSVLQGEIGNRIDELDAVLSLVSCMTMEKGELIHEFA